MAIIQTPVGILETNIPTLYGQKHQFRGNDGNSFDIPDWVGWLALIVGLVSGGAVGGYVAWNTRGAVDAFTDVQRNVSNVGNWFGKTFFGTKKGK